MDYNQLSWLFTPIFLTGFFFISGYLFTTDWEKVSIVRKCIQVLRGIIIPYFLFMAAFIMPKLILLHYDWHETIGDILLLRASWFVITIGVLQILYAITLKYVKKDLSFVFISVFYGIIGFSCILFYRNLPEWFISNPILHSDAMPGCMPACINLAFVSTPFFSLGILYRKHEKSFKVNANILLGVIVLIIYLCFIIYDHKAIGTSFTYSSCSCDNYGLIILYFLIAMISLIMIAKKVDKIKPLNYIGSNTLLFYYFNIIMH